MSNNLSRQLCELCGIEPVIEDSCKISDKYWKNSHKIKGIHDDYVQRYCPYDMECTAECEYFYEKQIYPDFTKPENFVRLFDLTLPQKGIPTIAEFVTYEHLTIADSKDFLAKLIEMLKDDSYVADIKQSIREAEWVYE